MEHGLDDGRPATFMIRVLPGAAGSLSGHIHHLRTGEKRRFDDVQELGAALLEMVGNPTPDTETS
jgi:hypothetical protein